MLKRLAGYVDSAGVLHLISQSERSQWRNREEVVERFQALMQQALKRRKRRKANTPHGSLAGKATAGKTEARVRTSRARGRVQAGE